MCLILHQLSFPTKTLLSAVDFFTLVFIRANTIYRTREYTNTSDKAGQPRGCDLCIGLCYELHFHCIEGKRFLSRKDVLRQVKNNRVALAGTAWLAGTGANQVVLRNSLGAVRRGGFPFLVGCRVAFAETGLLGGRKVHIRLCYGLHFQRSDGEDFILDRVASVEIGLLEGTGAYRAVSRTSLLTF